jgi:hypothetical protein
MINLLTNSEKRRLQFVEILSNREKWMTLSDLSDELNCSDRVLKDDMTYFRDNFSEFEIESSYRGVRLVFKQDKGLKFLYRKILSESTVYHLLEIIFLNENKSIVELANTLFVSTSTLYRMIDQINDEVLKFDFKVESSPCRVIGQEENIRYFYYQYFFEKYSHLHWPFKTVDEEAVDQLLNFFIDITQIPADFAFYNVFKTVTVTNLIRYKNGHEVDTEDIAINFDEIIPHLEDYAENFKQFEEALQLNIDSDLIHQLFTPYVQEEFSLSVERMFEKAEINQKLANEITLLEDILTNIATANEIPVVNKEFLILALINSAHLEYQEPQSGYILYNRNKYFAEAIQAEFPKFYQLLYEGMKTYRQFLRKPMTEDGINFFIYTLFTFWPNLVPALRKKFADIQVIIISNRHSTHARMLKDFIEHELPNQLTIDIYTAMDLNSEILEALDCDFIVSNFPLPDLESKDSVYIEKVPTYNDLRKIQNVIDALIKKQHQN